MDMRTKIGPNDDAGFDAAIEEIRAKAEGRDLRVQQGVLSRISELQKLREVQKIIADELECPLVAGIDLIPDGLHKLVIELRGPRICGEHWILVSKGSGPRFRIECSTLWPRAQSVVGAQAAARRILQKINPLRAPHEMARRVLHAGKAVRWAEDRHARARENLAENEAEFRKALRESVGLLAPNGDAETLEQVAASLDERGLLDKVCPQEKADAFIIARAKHNRRRKNAAEAFAAVEEARRELNRQTSLLADEFSDGNSAIITRLRDLARLEASHAEA